MSVKARNWLKELCFEFKRWVYEVENLWRVECKSLNFRDREIIDHLDSLYPKLPHSIGYEKGIFTELYPKPKDGEDMKKRRWR